MGAIGRLRGWWLFGVLSVVGGLLLGVYFAQRPEILVEFRRWQIPGLYIGLTLLIVLGNLEIAVRRLIWNERASSVPFIGLIFGLMALFSVPVELSSWVVWSVVIGLMGVEFVSTLRREDCPPPEVSPNQVPETTNDAE